MGTTHPPAENTEELRCMVCGKWLDQADLSCGLSQLCTDDCLEPDNAHVDFDEDEYERG